MDFIINVLRDTVVYLFNTLVHNFPALAIGVFVAAAIQTYVDPERMRLWLMRRSSVSIPATVAFGAFTPFCACGTMAVVLSMMATALPWGPIMAFLTSSPLMSPEGFVMISGIISPKFAIALAAASVVIGLGAGYITHLIEKKTKFLDNQLRFAGETAQEQEACGCSSVPAKETSSCGCSSTSAAKAPACGCSAPAKPVAAVACCAEADEDEDSCGCGGDEPDCCGTLALEPAVKVKPLGSFFRKIKADKLFASAYDVGIRKILPLFSLFAGIGYIINRFIPSSWISALFGAHNVFAVPLAALVGLPLYVNGDSSIPLIQSLMQSGVSGGAMLAFMITGPGTSAGVLAGITTIMKKKAIGLYVAYLFGGAMIAGYLYDLFIAFAG